MRKQYATLKIPLNLAEEMDKKLVGKHGFANRAEIAKEGIRRVILDWNQVEEG